jgi:hypothetical protein
MSITDSPVQKNLTDVFPPGTPFVIQSAWIEGVVKTQFGDRTMGKVLVSAAEGGTPQEFPAWGSLCEQIQQVDEGELPGTFTIVKDGKRYLFAPVEDAGDPLAEAEEKSPDRTAETAATPAESSQEPPAEEPAATA